MEFLLQVYLVMLGDHFLFYFPTPLKLQPKFTVFDVKEIH